jgi:hypothetical protein
VEEESRRKPWLLPSVQVQEEWPDEWMRIGQAGSKRFPNKGRPKAKLWGLARQSDQECELVYEGLDHWLPPSLLRL